MRLELVKRPQRSNRMALISPAIAIALTLVTSAVMFAAIGIDPMRAL